MSFWGTILAIGFLEYMVIYLLMVADQKVLADAVLLRIIVIGVLFIGAVVLMILSAALSFLGEKILLRISTRMLFESIFLGISLMFGTTLIGAMWYTNQARCNE